MTPDVRPDPDALLAHAKRQGRGGLRVYLGMSPGVGKTFEMLEAAQRRRGDGRPVLVGLIETHGRAETEALLDGLEVLPRAPIEHRGQVLMEFDLDAVLARRPELVLVDEYAHSNAPGARHPKRWQDVEELLDAGIDVWTTLNVQHLESLVDVVWRITGVRQRETVPDQALSDADQIVLVDVTPEELRARLEAGKVYVPQTARLAGDRFFKLENLTALRELALRRAAQTVDDQLSAAMKRGGIQGPWAAGERILVLVAGDAMAPALVRAGRRLADLMMDAPWTVATVELTGAPPPGPERGRRVAEAMKLAEQLGAATLTLTGADLPDTVLDHARRNNITQIVLGKPPRRRWARLLGRELAQALLDRSGGAALHFVTEASPGVMAGPSARSARTSRRPRPWGGYALAAGVIAAATALALALDRSTGTADVIYLAAVLSAGLFGGLRPALFAALLAMTLYDFLFLEPIYTLSIGRPNDILTFAIFFAAAGLTGWTAGRVRDRGRLAQRRASAVATLLSASRRLSAAPTRQAAAQALAEQAAEVAGGGALVLLPRDGEVSPAAGAPDVPALSAAEAAAARWAWHHGEAAGAGTGTLPQIGWTFRPLLGMRAPAGVAGYTARADRTPEDERLLAATLDQGAVALERAELAADQARAAAARKSDQLRGALLNSISHDLRTPLATVMGAASTLIELGAELPAATRADLVLSIREEAERLDGYVSNLLDMTRLEGDALQPRREFVDVRDVLASAVARVRRRLGARTLSQDYPADLPLVALDPALLEQAVVNVLENAVAYSPADTPIEVAAYEDRANVVISVEDEGKGIPSEELGRVFDRFRRLEAPSDRERGERGKGVGLGLSISKGFVEAMGGRIAAASPIHADPAGGRRGTRILISLPKPRAAEAAAAEAALEG